MKAGGESSAPLAKVSRCRRCGTWVYGDRPCGSCAAARAVARAHA